jgi:hypothetical protein
MGREKTILVHWSIKGKFNVEKELQNHHKFMQQGVFDDFWF